MHALTVHFTRADEPPAFEIAQERILDPIGTVQIGLREAATGEGLPSVTMILPLAGGMYAVVETTWRLWETVAKGCAARIEMWKENPL